jgi:hypothetical protein
MPSKRIAFGRIFVTAKVTVQLTCCVNHNVAQLVPLTYKPKQEKLTKTHFETYSHTILSYYLTCDVEATFECFQSVRSIVIREEYFELFLDDLEALNKYVMKHEAHFPDFLARGFYDSLFRCIRFCDTNPRRYMDSIGRIVGMFKEAAELSNLAYHILFLIMFKHKMCSKYVSKLSDQIRRKFPQHITAAESCR